MNRTIKIVLCIVVAAAIAGTVALACYKAVRPYDADDFIGLTYEQIVERCGSFDICRSQNVDTGRYSACGYTVREKRVGFLGTDPPEYFMIYFDHNGIAVRCAYETGGWGG